MRDTLLDILCCPECRRFPLTLNAFAGAEREAGSEVETGYLRCSSCDRFYFIDEGIPRLVGEGFGRLIDTSFVERNADAFGPDLPQAEAYLERIRQADRDSTVQWNLDDVEFWDADYGNSDEVESMFEKLTRARRGAGGRAYPRERTLFRHIRPALRGGALLDLGCGLAQTVRTLVPPEEEGYHYIGADLSLPALRVNRQTMRGDFVLCSVDRIPFREGSVDAVIMLGTLHHLAEHEPTLERVIDTVRPGGFVGLDEVVAKHGLRNRLMWWRPIDESPHNEFVDASIIRRVLDRRGEIVEWTRYYSPVRTPMDSMLAETMRSRPWLTRAVIGLDRAVIRTLGRRWPLFAGSELLALGRRR